MSWIWAGMVSASLLYSLFAGTTDAVAAAVFEGAGSAADLCLAMVGAVCLWSGVMEILSESGLAKRLSWCFRPVLKRLFPVSSRDVGTLEAISANLSANFLGLGNAATPLGIRAAQRMAARCPAADRGKTASDELCLLVVLNTASVQLLPATVASLRAACGSATPFDILPAVWVTSLASVTVGIAAARALAKRGRRDHAR